MESPDILMNSGLPVVTAFVLGLLTAISPCPLATNITAIGFISRDIGNRKRIFETGYFIPWGGLLPIQSWACWLSPFYGKEQVCSPYKKESVSGGNGLFHLYYCLPVDLCYGVNG